MMDAWSGGTLHLGNQKFGGKMIVFLSITSVVTHGQQASGCACMQAAPRPQETGHPAGICANEFRELMGLKTGPLPLLLHVSQAIHEHDRMPLENKHEIQSGGYAAQ